MRRITTKIPKLLLSLKILSTPPSLSAPVTSPFSVLHSHSNSSFSMPLSDIHNSCFDPSGSIQKESRNEAQRTLSYTVTMICEPQTSHVNVLL